jgi:purine catabolism regulator
VALQGENDPSPRVRVEDVFRLPAFGDAGIEVVAGAQALGREVGWVHSSELADIHTFLRGGELLLTAGTNLGDAEPDQRRYISQLSRAGASGLVLELGRGFRRVPRALCDEADRRGLAVAVLHKEVPFAEVMRTVHGWIIGRRYELLERAETMAGEFNSLLLSGGTVSQVVHKLRELTGLPVVLEDAARQIVEYAADGPDVDAVLHAWGAHSRQGHDQDCAGTRRSEGETRCAWAPITVRNELWGRIHLLALGGPLDQLDLIAVERSSAAIGLALLSDQHEARLREDTLADFLTESARRAPVDEARFLRHARSLGADFRGRVFGVLGVATSLECERRVVTTLQTASLSHKMPWLTANVNGSEVVLVGVPPSGDPTSELRRLADSVAAIELQSTGADPVVGVSRVYPMSALPRAFREADECLRYARVAHATGTVEHSELGLHLLLLALGEDATLAQFVETELGPLLTHDTQNRSGLLETLRVVIELDGNKSSAARALNIERRSVYYRLKRIEAVLGRRLDGYDTRLALGVALRALALIEDRSRELRSPLPAIAGSAATSIGSPLRARAS